MDTIETIQSTYFHKVTKKVCKNLNNGTQLLLSSSLSILTHVANADRKISPNEIGYLKYWLKKEFELEPKIYRELVKAYHFIFVKQPPNDAEIAASKAYLKTNLSEKDKRLFIDTLLCLSTADKDLKEVEKTFIKNVAFALDVNKKDFQEALLSTSLSLVQSIDEEIAKSDDLISDTSELNEITFASAHEFIDSLD